jgi:hypothetical protein
LLSNFSRVKIINGNNLGEVDMRKILVAEENSGFRYFLKGRIKDEIIDILIIEVDSAEEIRDQLIFNPDIKIAVVGKCVLKIDGKVLSGETVAPELLCDRLIAMLQSA